MTEPSSAGVSVFAKLLAIMLTMALSLLLLVTAFFLWLAVPALNRSIEPLVGEWARLVATSQPGLEAARRMSDRLDLEVRYQGPAGAWATSEALPSIARARSAAGHRLLGSGIYVAQAPDGGTYLFDWTFRRNTAGAHRLLFALLLLLMAGAVLSAHMVIRRLLLPLRSLGEGVARLSAGELDVALPAGAGDEFGVLTRAFNGMVGRVRDMIRARDQLLVDVSHELRSPLTRMRVAIELLPDGRDRASMAADVAEMEAMISELLELERLRDGRGIRVARQDLVPIVRAAVESFRNQSPGVRIVALPDELPLEIDGERIGSVLRNLVENAVKYSLPDSRPVEVAVAGDDESVVLRVRDDGPGVPEADRATLFEPFFRADRARSKSPSGYGLGLSICKRIVDAHGGTLEIHNRAGRGAELVVTLKRRANDAPGSPGRP